MQTLNICMVGAGVISSFHMDAYRKNERAIIYGIHDINGERARAKAEQYSISHVFETFADALADDKVDVIHICTRNDTHAALSIEALQAGKHVFVEKPMAISLEEARQVQKVAKDHDRTFQVGLVRRFATNTKMAHSWITDGNLGDIYYVKATHIRRAGNPGSWFSKKELSGGGPLIDLGIHLIDVCWYIMGKPAVHAISSNMYEKLGSRQNVKSKNAYQSVDVPVDESNVEDLVNAIVRFDNDASLVLDVSYSLHAKEDHLQIEFFGTKGGIILEPELTFVMEDKDTMLNVLPQMDGRTFQMEASFTEQVNDFVEKCLLEEKSSVPIEDGLAVMEIIDHIYRSAALGRAVYVQESSVENKG